MSLSSLIVQREIATIRQVEEALARQVLYGGDFVTNLLEVTLVDEEKLALAAADALGKTPAPAGVLPPPDIEASAFIPADLASRRSLYPLALGEGGDSLIVVVAEPLTAEEDEQMMFALGIPIQQRIAPLVRIRQALAREFGAPLDRRHERLIRRIDGDKTVSSTVPPMLRDAPRVVMASGQPAVRIVSSVAAPPAASHVAPDGTQPSTDAVTQPMAMPGAPASDTAMSDDDSRTVAIDRKALERMLAADAAHAASQDGVYDHDWAVPDSGAPGSSNREPRNTDVRPPPLDDFSPTPPEGSPLPALVLSPTDAIALPLVAPAEHPPSSDKPTPRDPSQPPGPGNARSNVLQGTVDVVTREAARATLLRAIGTAQRPPRRRRGPLTYDAARREVEDAADRDALLDLFFDFSRQYFDYSVLFIVHGDLAEGRDAYGAGASRDKVTGIGVPLDMSGVLATTRERKIPFIGKPGSGLDGVLLADLERKVQEVMIVPLVVRGRVVALIYGDAGDMAIDPPHVADVSTFATVVGQGFERIILRKKLGGFGPGTKGTFVGRVDSRLPLPKKESLPPPKDDGVEDRAQRAEALGRALFPAANVSRVGGAAAPSTTTGTENKAAPPPKETLEVEPPPETSLGTFAIPRRRAHYASDNAPAARPGSRNPPAEPARPSPPPAAKSPPPEPRDSPPPPPRTDPSSPPADAPAVDNLPGRLIVSGPELNSGELDDAEARAVLDEIANLSPEPEDIDLEIVPGPASQTIVLPPHHPPTSRTDQLKLPSVIVDVARELVVLVEHFIEDPHDEQAETELLRQGAHAMPAIMRHFPGPIVSEPNPEADEVVAVSACGPILRLIAAQRKVAVPFVVALVASPDETKRFWATFLLSELPYPEAVLPLLPRLTDESDRVRRVATLAAAGVARYHGEDVAREMGRIVRDSRTPLERRVRMLEVLEEIRESFAVPTFIASLTDEDEELSSAAKRALVVVARQDFGRDARKWTGWWNQNSSRHRVEWLIDSLTHDVGAIRRAAGDELKSMTKEYFGYYDDLARRDRERAQARYREWWLSEGRHRFRSA